MRYILPFLVLIATGCSGQQDSDQKAKIDTAKLFDPNPHSDEVGASEVNIFKRNIVLTQPDYYGVLNDSEYKLKTLEKVKEFIKSNKKQIQQNKFYIITDSSTSFKKTLSIIDILKENEITNYKVINYQQYLTPPEQVIIDIPPSVVTTLDKNDSTNFSIELLKEGFSVRLRGQDTNLKTIPELNDFIAANKSNIGTIIIIISRDIPNERFPPITDVLKKNGFYKYNLVQK